MQHQAVRMQNIHLKQPTRSIRRDVIKGNDRYDLATAIGIVRRVETSEGRSAVFEEIKNKNLLYRIVDALYRMAGSRFFQPPLLLIYMIKCVVSVGPLDVGHQRVVSLANFPNEHGTIDRVANLVPMIDIHRMSIDRRHIFGFSQIAAAFSLFCSAARLLPFLSKLARRHTFMPAARIASTLAFYMVFLRYFRSYPQIKAAVISSNYSPEAAGMAAAAHRASRRVVYANHAPVPWNGIAVQPVLSDCALFYGAITTETYLRRSRCTAEVALIGQPGISREMEWRDELRTVGIFLTSGTKIDTLSKLISAVHSSLPQARILVRDHPVALLKNNLSSISAQVPNMQMSVGRSLDDDIAACDVVICGNSGVTLNVLSGGRPVVYIDDLDIVASDSNGFLENGLVYHAKTWSDEIYLSLKSFYAAPGWVELMQRYDASYNVDTTQLEKVASAILKSYL